MEIQARSESVLQYQGDAVVVGAVKGEPLSGPAAEADRALDGMLSRLVQTGEIRGKQSEVTVVHTHGKVPAARVAVVGLGQAAEDGLLPVRRAMGAAARVLRDRGCRRVGTLLHEQVPAGTRPEHGIRAIVEGAYVGLYRGGERKSEQELPEELDELSILALRREEHDYLAPAIRAARVGAEATNFARRLVNLPANDITPTRLADEAAAIGNATGMAVEVMEPDRIRELGMGAFLAVAQGSEEPARLITLRHRLRESGPRLAFIGKGLTFDSGGISLKTADKMETMKQDMAGAAAVLGAMRAVGELDLGLDLMGIIPAAENLPSGRAYKPGDVLTAMSGKTIEVISTDAEGRLLLADALAYARQKGATHLIDIATLTGACIIALGHVAAGIMSNDNALAEAVLDAGERAGERLWRLPLFPEYREQVDSKVADLKNVGGRAAGAITAGWFLREFVGETAWAHLDVAGTAWSEKDEPHQVQGATGAGVRTLLAVAERMAGGSP
jgi:leucyl aminopeptidase